MPIKVAAIHRKKVAYHACNDSFSWVRIGLLQPIPLTPEILVKNGFRAYPNRRGYNNTTTYLSDDWRIEFKDDTLTNSFNKWSVHVDTEDMRTMGYFEITYVHELQHALRLCRIDKEIEL